MTPNINSYFSGAGLMDEGLRRGGVNVQESFELDADAVAVAKANGHHTRLVVDKNFPRGVRPYSVREWARLQGLPDTYQFPCSDKLAYRMIGNGVSEPVGHWIGSELVRYFNRNTMN